MVVAVASDKQALVEMGPKPQRAPPLKHRNQGRAFGTSPKLMMLEWQGPGAPLSDTLRLRSH